MNFHYFFKFSNPQQRLIPIICKIKNIQQSSLQLHLPAWRPGRYEIGNFAKNIFHFQVFSKQNKLFAQKINKDTWEINTEGCNEIEVHYAYYAAEWNAGSSFICDSFLYVNPVNCCLFATEAMHLPCFLSLEIPETFQTAISKEYDSHYACYHFEDFHDLADTPFISGALLQSISYTCENTPFTIWFNGILKDIPTQKVIDDFLAFTQSQHDAFGSFPFKKYNFYFHALPYLGYHGVEHLESTVITLGPAEHLFTERYEDLLGVSSHELYHTWNVKTIRPEALLPYDYTKENYTTLGYVAEGVTTYMGDQMLLRSQVFSREEWKKTFNQLLERHYQNFGRFNYSVAESSYDTWLDGYQAGAPNRKVSIYTEGALYAFMADILIRKNTMNNKSLDDAMQWLYKNIAQAKKGYTALDFQAALEAVSEISFFDFFKNYYNGQEDITPLLTECLAYIGYKLNIEDRKWSYETFWGVKFLFTPNACKVQSIFPNSEIDQAGIALGDELIEIESSKTIHAENIAAAAKADKVTLVFKDVLNQEKKISLHKGNYFKQYEITRLHEMNELQARQYAIWAGVIELVH